MDLNDVAYLHVSRDFVGVRIWRVYFTAKDLRKNKPLFSERERIRCRHVTFGPVRLKVQWR